jgi:hypothetical protein
MMQGIIDLCWQRNTSSVNVEVVWISWGHFNTLAVKFAVKERYRGIL